MRACRRSIGFLFTAISGGAHNRPPKSMECREDSDPEAPNTFLRSTPTRERRGSFRRELQWIHWLLTDTFMV